MQGGRDPFFGFGDPFSNSNGFSGFGGQRSLMSNFFGGRDPFDDPFFSNPFGDMFGSSFFGSNRSPFMLASSGSHFSNPNTHFLDPNTHFLNPNTHFLNPNTHFLNSNALEHQPTPSNLKGPIIEELKSDDEKDEDGEEEKVNSRKHGRPSEQGIVEDPDDVAAEKKHKHMPQRNYSSLVHHGMSQPQAQSYTFQSSSVTYGGGNGAYYTTSTTRRSGSDGVRFEEFKEANSSTGQATHRVSRGIHEKGHSSTRKLHSEGHVETLQTLHNLNQDELAGFDKAWIGNAQKHLPGWSEQHDPQNVIASGGSQRRGGWALPSSERSDSMGSLQPDANRGAGFPSLQPGRMKFDTGHKANRH